MKPIFLLFAVSLLLACATKTDTTDSFPVEPIEIPKNPALTDPLLVNPDDIPVTPNPANSPTNQECTQDSDCIKVPLDCCNCNYGGKAMAIPATQRQNHVDALAQQCGDIVCLTVISDDPTCFAKPKCSNGECVLE